MSIVNGALTSCLPEDAKSKYYSPQWLEAHNACLGDFEQVKKAPKETKRKIQIPYKIGKHINTAIIEWKDVDSFSMSNLVDVLHTLKRNDFETIILDMRGNTGGSIYDMKAFLRLPLSARNHPYLITRRSQQRTDEYVVKKDGVFSKFKWFVLVNNKSASAAEIIAGVLQGQGAVIAVIIGEQTYGKGTVQERWFLFRVGKKECPGMLKLTTRQIFFEDETSPEGVGITPDIVVTDSEFTFETPLEYISSRILK